MKTRTTPDWPERQPGPLASFLGAHVEQFMALNSPVQVSGEWGTSEARLFAEQLTPDAGAWKSWRRGTVKAHYPAGVCHHQFAPEIRLYGCILYAIFVIEVTYFPTDCNHFWANKLPELFAL